MKKTNLIFTTFFAFALFFIACKKEEFVVTFNANGGTGTMETQTFKAGKSQVLIANAFTNKGYTFTGWNTNPNGTGGTTYKNQETVSVLKNMTLYAQWALMDIDGNIYKTVQIGTQLWMKENLRVTKYKTGENIPVITDAGQWANSRTGAMCYFGDKIENALKYGALYNGYTAITGKLCPEGWRVPSNNDWILLANYLGGEEIAGHKMKADYGWTSEDGVSGNGSNESGFTAVSAGHCNEGGGFGGLGLMTAFWNSTEGDMQYLLNTDRELHTYKVSLAIGYSVRCVKE